VLRYESDPEAPTVSAPTSIPELKPMDTRSIEIGYKGNFQNRTFVGIDFFYAKTKNHLSGLRPVTPLVFVPNLPQDLTEEIYRVFTDDELAHYKLSRQDLAWLYGTVIESLGEQPVGVLEPNENYDVTRGPEQLLSWINYGKADYFGVDFEFRRIENEYFSYFGNFSWISDNYFDDAALDEAGTGLDLALNAPRFKVAAGFDRTFLERLRLSVAGRYIDNFDVRSGVHTGYVFDYFLLDAGLGMDLDEVSPGLRLDVTAENLLDHEHREWVDVPAAGRQVTARLSYAIL
jgi:iron complex outermembrane receptor protein